MAEGGDDRMAALEAQLQQLMAAQQQTPVINVKVPVAKKIRRFAGHEEENVHDWVEDVRGLVSDMASTEAAQFILRHLDGAAREEVKYETSELRADPRAILSTLEETFGEKQSGFAIRTLLCQRRQLDSESVRDFTRSLMEIFDRLCRKDPSVRSNRDKILCEALAENVKDKYLRCELRRMIRENRLVSFQRLREHAINFADDEDVKPKRSRPGVNLVEVDSQVVSTSTDKERIDDLTRKFNELSKGQAAIMDKLNNFGNQWQPNFRRPQHSNCYHCHQPGHFKRNCPLLQPNPSSQQQPSYNQGNGQAPLL